MKYVPVTEDMLKEMYKQSKKPKIKIKQITHAIFVVTKRTK